MVWGGQTVSFGAHDHGQLLRRPKPGIRQPQGILPQGHGRRLKAHGMEQGLPVRPLREVGPGDLKHGAHADPGGPAVQRVAAGTGQQYGIHAEGRGGAEDGPQIRGIHDVFQHGNPPGTGADLLHRGQGRPGHFAEHPSGQVKARQLGQDL